MRPGGFSVTLAGMSESFLDFYRDTRTGDVFIWAGRSGRHVRLRFLDAKPGDPDGVLEYDVRTFLSLVRRGILEVIPYVVEMDDLVLLL